MIHIHVVYRPGSIQTRQQIEIVQQFSVFLSPLWQFYPSSSPPPSQPSALTFQQYLNNQALLLHGYQLEDLKYIPKVLAGMVYMQWNRSIPGRTPLGQL